MSVFWSWGAPAHGAGGVTGTLRGTIVDASTSTPLEGVSVVLIGTSGTYKTNTDSHGFFTLLEVPTDTYALSISKHGYLSIVISGVTVLGDQTQNVGTIKLPLALKTLATVRATARSSSAFQPTQTVDETTFVGARVDQALGEKGSTNFSQLVLSAPGVIPTAPGSLNDFSIRGSASVEIGYQFDGVDYRGEFFDENPSQGFLNGIGGGHGGLQVVSGAGDATQGGIGAGVINVIPGRGSYPGDGFVSFDVSSPWYDHSMAFQYGVGSPNGTFSDFISTRSDRYAPTIAPYGRDASDAGQYLGTSFTYDDDVLNNFYYRFGKGQDQQIQVLADFLDHRSWAEYGGLSEAGWYPDNPYSYDQFETDYNGAPMWPCAPPPGLCGLQWYQSVITYIPGVPHPNAQGLEPPLNQPEEYLFGPTDFLKIGYTRNINPTTALNAFFYNWGGLVENNITGNSSDLTDGSNLAGYNLSGGRRVGFQTQLTKQAGEKHTLSLVAKFENGFPYWVQQNDGNTWQGFDVARSQDEANFPNGIGTIIPVNGPRVEDW
ncbi:MAG TPA: TonB-dependent receptor [Candidatus Eremiobacteraceae bacterium]|nr:TonB-dependent receptor [Candidatus Eremiobacteraceae bacterium]